MNSERIYLDYAATTPMRTEVTRAVFEAVPSANFNPSSPHAEGRRARTLLDDARDKIAAALGASRYEIVCTSGGTEAANLALFGVAHGSRGGHVLASAVEHPAVLSALDRLREEGYETELLPVDDQGRVEPERFERALRPQTILASVMYANNEVGSIQPVAEIAALARRRGVLFHTDAVAAAMWLPLDVGALGVDLLSISGHKLYGPKGTGCLYVRRGIELAPVILGGGQESGRRGGTENLLGVVGLAHALELAVAERPENGAKAAALRDRLEAGISAAVSGVRANGAEAARLPNLLNLSFEGVEAGELLVALDLAGIAVSAGSACTSGALKPSHVLAAMGGSSSEYGGIRLSLGTGTTAEEIDRVVERLPRVVEVLRAGSPSSNTSGGMGRLEPNRARLEAEA